jgi:probable addiction module antidote protein
MLLRSKAVVDRYAVADDLARMLRKTAVTPDDRGSPEEAALEDPNPDVFLAAVGHVAKARGMSAIAERAGLGRESLYKALAPGAKPRYDMVLKVLQSLGVKLTVSPA